MSTHWTIRKTDTRRKRLEQLAELAGLGSIEVSGFTETIDLALVLAIWCLRQNMQAVERPAEKEELEG
jgi:hypothetical protein